MIIWHIQKLCKYDHQLHQKTFWHKKIAHLWSEKNDTKKCANVIKTFWHQNNCAKIITKTYTNKCENMVKTIWHQNKLSKIIKTLWHQNNVQIWSKPFDTKKLCKYDQTFKHWTCLAQNCTCTCMYTTKIETIPPSIEVDGGGGVGGTGLD